MARVSLILVTWNSARFLPRCLDGIAQQTFRDIELIAVDNASVDDSAAIVRSRFPAATILQNAANEGFSRAVNQGIARASGEFVQLVNPDAFLEPEYVAKLVEAMESPRSSVLSPRMSNGTDLRTEDRGPRTDIGSATGKLLRADGSGVDSKGIRMTRTGRHFDIEEGEEREVFGVSGAAAMHRMSFIRDVTLSDGQFLDEDFFTYREDADVAWRGRLFGWRAAYVPEAVGWHVRTVTPERRRELPAFINMHSVKNRFMMRMKNEGLYLALRNAPFELARDLVIIAAVLTIERSSLPAFPWLWRNRKRIFAKRREIQRRRRVSDRALARWFR
ncbi:MAG TPA: glycosyltransferase family 2 protein [Thermoanaerobaculia bacterium]|jgi:GT2 family glycosyltransferase|nr:glycosyltransferase family 2 protein [Thermoanaerobaculia bacterium]